MQAGGETWIDRRLDRGTRSPGAVTCPLRPHMHPIAFAAPDPHRLAHAFLALGDDFAPERLQRSLVRAVAAFAAALVLAVAAPLTWTGPA